MVPLQLALRNFMSYGEETTLVDFRDMQVICLSGENGHGKSALLDAITWALWGETRVGKQNHDQLVRIGSDEMSVILDFQNGGETYRVRRQRSRKTSGNIWELQIEEAGGSWRSLTAQGASDTGRAIVDLLRMSYETFLNSAYLRQGRADEFVRQSANKRKEILAEILDLSRYDELEAHARQKKSEAGDKALDEDRSINRMDAEIAGAADAPDRLKVVEEQVAGMTSERAEMERASEVLAEARAKLNAERAKLNEIEARRRDLEKRRAAHNQQAASDQEMIEQAGKLIATKQKIEQDVSSHERLLQRLEQLQIDAQQFRSLEARRLHLEQKIDGAKRELQRDLQLADSELSALRSKLALLPQLDERLLALNAAQTQARGVQLRIEALDTERLELKGTFAELSSDKKRCDLDIAETQKRLERILDQNESCSICGSPLPESKLHTLAEECAAEVESLQSKLAYLMRDGKQVKTRVEHVDADIREAQAAANRLQEGRLELARLQQQRQSLSELQVTEPGLRQRLESLNVTLASGGFALSENVELTALLIEHSKVAGAEAELIEAQRQERGLRTAEAVHARLLAAERDLLAATSRLDSLRVLIAEIDEQAAGLTSLSADAPAVAQKLAANQAEREKLQIQSSALAAQLQQAERERGRLQSTIERVTMLARQRVERLAALKDARNDEDLYTLLAGAFGKRGVQALIIENALPELENDANDLLQRLTDGQMSLTLQTTRQAKSKAAGDAPIETLDIVISDSLGSRPLEMYSGGESFRISFALRIALSKLLARHAGAQLQTLIIDEGFGTQDARGREKLVDSIMAVQSDFAQIIVITHVEEIKDAFANRIEVFKTPSGSEVNLVVGAALG